MQYWDVCCREEISGGISQYVDLEQNENYYFTAYVQLLNDNGGTMGHNLACMAEINYQDGRQNTRHVPQKPVHLVPNIIQIFA